MTNQPITTDDDHKLTRSEEAHVRELEHLAANLKKDNLLYGSALDGMQPTIQAAADKVASYDLDTKMAAAEDEIAATAADVLEKDVADAVATEKDLDADDGEEDELLKEDENEPEEAAA